MNWVEQTIIDNKKSIRKFKSLDTFKRKYYIHYSDLTFDMRYIFRRYFNITRKDIGDNEIIIANNSKDGVLYAENQGHILYDLDKVAFNNILLEMKQENRKYKRILNKKEGNEF